MHNDITTTNGKQPLASCIAMLRIWRRTVLVTQRLTIEKPASITIPCHQPEFGLAEEESRDSQPQVEQRTTRCSHQDFSARDFCGLIYS